MKVIKGLNNLKNPIKNSVLTIGIFDGVHVGHVHIIKKMVERAKELHTKSAVLTFEPHPLKVLKRSPYVPSLISLKHRIGLIEAIGVDILVILKFTKRLSNLSAEDFVRRILIKRLGMKELYVGDNFSFGKGARIGVDKLRRLAKRFNFKVKAFRPVTRDGFIASSSLIRRFILNGDIKEASRLLGRPVSVLGTVTRGSRRGRILGFPTANINPHHEAIPPAGVYAVKVKFDRRLFKGVLNIGMRPTFYREPGGPEPTIEVHIFNFDKKIYGKDLEISFVKKMRDEIRFKDKVALARQIRKDVKASRAILN